MSDPNHFDFNELATKNFQEGVYADYVHFVHIYVIEPHPQDPDISPYRGDVWEAQYSTRGQPTDYPGRVSNANAVVGDIQGNQMMLVDDLRPRDQDNPLWCTYGPCPNCAYLIGMDGTIHTVQNWANATDMETAINSILP